MLNNKKLLNVAKNISVLYVEDEEMAREQYKGIFDLLFQEVTGAINGLDALEKYKKGSYDLLITDLTMPQMDGMALINKILEIKPDQHIIIMTAHNTKENLRASIDVQVDGILLKPVEKDKLFQLLNKVCHYIESEKREALVEQEEMRSDNLVLHEKEDAFIVVIDQLNQLIKEFGIEVKNFIFDAVRKHLDNFGFEKENILFVYNDAILFTRRHSYLEKILEALQDFSQQHNAIAVEFHNLKIYVTLSYGVLRLKDKKDTDGYLHYIDHMIDEIKDNKYSTDIVTMDIDIEEAKKTNALSWLSTTLDALEQKAIVPFYQPTVDINGLQIKSYEIYARIKQDEKYILPKFFIDLSEKAGLLEDISKVLFKHAFERLATTEYSFHINLSNSDLRDHSYVEYLCYLCTKFSIEHKRVIVNILNHTEIKATGKRVNAILKLKELGFKIALKEFTCAIVNMELISKIEPDFIKIDQLLVQKSLQEHSMKLMLSSLLQTAAKANIETILYNVEDEDILNEGRALGFDYVQGYLIAKPSDTLEPLQIEEI